MVTALLLVVACKPTVPSRYIQPDDMEDLIYDYYMAQGIASQQSGNIDYNRCLNFELVLKKHGVSQADFDSSLVYYYTRADRFQDIYKNVQTRLNNEAEKYGGVVRTSESIDSGTLGGDTADVWKGERMLMLLNDRPYHLYQFSQKADTTFHAGDSFVMSFNTSWLMQNGNRQATAYFAVVYENESIAKQYSTISSNGPITMRISYCKLRIKEIKGYVMCGMRPSKENVNNLCLLFVNNIQLIRFHNKLIEEPEAAKQSEADSIPSLNQDTAKSELAKPELGRPPKIRIDKPDSLRRPMHRISPTHNTSERPLTVGDISKMRQQIKKN